MRLGRVVFLAGLAPILGWAAALSAHPETAKQVTTIESQDSLAVLFRTGLWRTVAVLVSADRGGEQSIRASHSPSPQSVLALDALAETPMGRSLWMVAGPSARLVPFRPPLRSQLRC